MVGATRGDSPDRRLQRPRRRPADLRRTVVEGPRPQGVEQAETLPLAGHRRTSGCCARSRPTSRADRRRRPDGRAGHRPGRRHRPARADAAPVPLRPTRSPTSAAPRTPWPTWSSPPAGTPTSSSGGSAPRRSRSPRRSSAGCCPASYTCEAGQFTLAGWLEPASSVGGDTFDYTLDRDTLQVSITDAVGHQVAAALLATLLVGSLRNGAPPGPRPGRAGAVRQRRRWPRTPRPASSSPGSCCASTCTSGTASIINAGHPLPAAAARRPGGGGRAASSSRRSASSRAGRSRCRTSRWSPATGSSSSPTACWSATPPPSTSPRPWPRAPTCTRARSSTSSAQRCCARPAATSATTPRWSASTGTAARRRGPDHRARRRPRPRLGAAL